MRMLLPALLMGIAALARGESTDYNVFPTAVTGSARTVALSGAIVSDPDGYEAVFVNPAGLSGLGGSGFDFGSDGNNVDNFVVDLNDPKSRSLNVPIKYSYSGLRFVTRSGWGLGFAAQTPFILDDVFNGTTRVVRRKGTVFVATGDINEVSTSADTYSLAAGKSFLGEKVAVGAAVNYTRVLSKYNFTPVISAGAPFARSATNDGWSGDLGMIAVPAKWLRLGAVYKMGYRVRFSPALNEGLPVAFVPFRDVQTPDRVAFGMRLAPREELRLYTQARMIFAMSDTVVSGSDVFPGAAGATIQSGRKTTLTGAWGLEYIPCDKNDLVAKLWAGGYMEDTNLQGGYARYHHTAGFSLAPWFLSFNMAIDRSEFYNNFVVGLGVDLLKAATRTANKYGWKLPI